MLVKKKKYWFDLDAVRVPYTTNDGSTSKVSGFRETPPGQGDHSGKAKTRDEFYKYSGKNPGDVWKIATQPFPQAHFATFPEKLVTRPILASCPKEICKMCGRARRRIIETSNPGGITGRAGKPMVSKDGKVDTFDGKQRINPGHNSSVYYSGKFKGWTDCGCNAGFEPGIVLDPFMGSGTVGVVARRYGRDWCGIELNPEYIKMAKQRISGQIKAMF
jgi:hypothetical protein